MLSRVPRGTAPARRYIMRNPRRGDSSPWGAIDYVEPIDGAVVFCATPSHGGAWVPDARASEMPDRLRRIGLRVAGGWWYEEDCAILAVVAVFGRPAERRGALEECIRQYPRHSESATTSEACSVVSTVGFHRCGVSFASAESAVLERIRESEARR